MCDRFYAIIQEAQDSGKLTDEQCKLLKQNKLAAKLLVEKTQGDIEMLSEKTATEILTEIETQAYNKGLEEKENEMSPIIKDRDETIISQRKQIIETQLDSLSKDIRACEIEIAHLTKDKADKEQERKLGHNSFMRIIRVGSFLLLVLIVVIGTILSVLDIKNGTNFFESVFTYLTALGIILGLGWVCITGKKYDDDEFLHIIREKYISRYNRIHNCSDETIDLIDSQIQKEKDELQKLNLRKEEMIKQYDEINGDN